MKLKPETKRPDTTDMYQFIWFTESGLPLECYLYFHESEADASMELMHALVNGEHDIADMLTYHVAQNIEQMALLDAIKKNRKEREKSAIWRHFQPRDYHSNASFLG